jgi:hypothetical protein
MYVQVDEPHIVYETIDGETILMDLRSGNYFSIEKSGVAIWEALAESGDVDALIRIAAEACEPGKAEQVKSDIQNFVKKLLEENLLRESSESVSSKITEEMQSLLKKTVSAMTPLEINKYSDMQEMLLLDPIHDVDEKGWPEPKKDDDEK